jgi:hypothetical protein
MLYETILIIGVIILVVGTGAGAVIATAITATLFWLLWHFWS